MPGATVEQLARVARQHQAQLLTIRDRTERALALTWQRTITGPDDTAAGAWLAAAVPLLAASQSTAAGLALSYVAGYVSVASGTSSPPSDLVAADFTDPRGVPAVELLMRPVIELRSLLADGVRYLDAFKSSELSVARIGATDPMLSYRAATTAAMTSNPRVVGYRRVPDGKACPFCLLAATQRYHDSDLMAMHPHCGCTVAPIVGSKDPGRVIDADTLERLRSQGVLDDINRRRRAQADREIGQRADAARKKADHWSAEAEKATDPVKRRRYEDRAAEWANKAKAIDGTLPAANVGAGQALIDELFAKPKNFTVVHQHGELGPVLYPAGQHFTAA